MKTKEDAAKQFAFTILMGILLLTGCAATVPVRIVPLVGANAYPPTDPATVIVLHSEPLIPFETLGQVVLEPDESLSVPDMEQMLRQAAASMGANAVVIIADMAMQTSISRRETSGGQVVSAIAIRYKD